MGRKTKIDWCDATWNPVTGCFHHCPYCYARDIARRFGMTWWECNTENGYDGDVWEGNNTLHVLDAPYRREWNSGKITKAPYPFVFDPTFYRYKLDEPQKWKEPKTVFVASMGDLFGEWVPDSWIEEIFRACGKATQHRYIFLTKNPIRYRQLRDYGIDFPVGSWIGTTVTCNADERKGGRTEQLSECWNTANAHWFVSIEPMLERFEPQILENFQAMDWVIIGAMTGRHENKVVPEKEWIMDIVMKCAISHTPVFMKESLRDIMGSDFKQEFPWGGGNDGE